MTNEEALKAWKKFYAEIDKENWLFVGTINPEMVSLAIKALDSQWIPVTFREADDEEYKDYIERNDYIPREECKVYDCQMPYDGQEVLITTSVGCVCEDIFHAGLDDFGFEDHYDPDEVIAWMPKPEPYKKGGDQ